jgi:sugar phosphate isomerase/epimerase
VAKEHILNPIALQTALLPGDSFDDQCRAAKTAGADGVELIANDRLYTALPEIAEALDKHDLRAAALRLGHTHLIDPDPAQREAAMVAIQDALTAAVDLGASGVVFYPHYAPHHVVPDLEPYKAAVELEAELLITLLKKTICDLANALNMRLLLAHADSGTSSLLRRPEHAAMIRARLEDHPMLYVASSLSHLDAEGIDAASALGVSGLAYLSICDTDGRLPGSGTRDWAAFASVMHAGSYNGWITIEGNSPAPVTALAGSIRALRRAGL